jgi:hypothetical protein
MWLSGLAPSIIARAMASSPARRATSGSKDCHFREVGSTRLDWAIYLGNTTAEAWNVAVIDNLVETSSCQPYGAGGIDVDSVLGTLIANNIVKGCASIVAGWGDAGSGTGARSLFQISGNVVQGGCIKAFAGKSPSSVIGNTICATACSAMNDGALALAWCDGVVAMGNHIFHEQGELPAYSIHLHASRNCVLRGNYVRHGGGNAPVLLSESGPNLIHQNVFESPEKDLYRILKPTGATRRSGNLVIKPTA